MLDETFGVRSESDSSEPNSPQPPSSSPLQLQHGHTGSPSDHDALHLGRVGMETEDGSVQKTMRHAPNDSTAASSPQQTGKGGGTDLKNDAQPGRTDAGWGRVRPTHAAVEHNSLAELSASKDPRSRSPAKTKRNDGGENQSSVVPSTINGKARSAGGVGVSPIEPSAMEEGTGTPGEAPVGVAPHPSLPAVYKPTNADCPLAHASPALVGTFPTASTVVRAPPSCHFPIAPPAALETPFDSRAAGTAAPLPLPVGRQKKQGQSTVGVAGAAATSIDDLVPTTSKAPSSSSASASAEDEAAAVELVGMGFDREHVVRALQECGRGESWKEAAISLLLEPQTSMALESRLSGGGHPEAAGQG